MKFKYCCYFLLTFVSLMLTTSCQHLTPSHNTSGFTISSQSVSSSTSMEISIPQKENYGDFLDDPSAPYMEISFDGVAYPDSVKIVALRDGKVYFSYRNDPPGETDQKIRQYKNLHQRFAYGFYDLITQTTTLLPGQNFLNAENQILCTSGETLLMPNGILYQQGDAAEQGCVTYITDFTGDGSTTILDYQEEPCVRPIAHLRAIDTQRFIMNFKDFGNYYNSLYLYDTSDHTVQLITELYSTEEEYAAAFDVYGETIWCYYMMGTGDESYHLLRRYALDGTLEKEYVVPETVSDYHSGWIETFAPAKMHCLAENVFYVPEFTNRIGFLLVIEGDTVVAKSIPQRESIRDRVSNTVVDPEVVYLFDEENCAILQLDVNTLTFRSLNIHPLNPEKLAWTNFYSDEYGNLIVQDMLLYNHSPDKKAKARYFYIPRSTIDQYSVPVA